MTKPIEEMVGEYCVDGDWQHNQTLYRIQKELDDLLTQLANQK